MSLLFTNDIYLPVTDLERSLNWFKSIFGVQIEWRREEKAKINFANHTAIVLVKSKELNCYTHIPFNLESDNMVKSQAMLIDRGVTVSKSSISDGFHCLDFFDPDGNRIGLVGSEVPGSMDQDDNIAVCATFLAVKNIDRAIEWYSEKFGLTFRCWSFKGGAGYNSDTYEHDITIKYASANYLHREGMTFAETPHVNQLIHTPYVIQSSNAYRLYIDLQGKGLRVTEFHDEDSTKSFEFIDIEGNKIGIIETDV